MLLVLLLSLTVAISVPTEPPRPTKAEILAAMREARHPQTITILEEGSPDKTYPVVYPILGPHGDEGWFYCREAYVPAGEGVWLNHREEYPTLAWSDPRFSTHLSSDFPVHATPSARASGAPNAIVSPGFRSPRFGGH
jgi:hypothetical protein